MNNNLNQLRIDIDRPGEHSDLRQFERAASKRSGNVSAFFDNLEGELIAQIAKADLVVGCVAWLTNPRILEALSKCLGASIIVQKEDFLRPDIATGDRAKWSYELRSRYADLKMPIDRYDMPGLISHLSVCGDPNMESVRCVGNYNRDKNPAFPRAHHKFVVFCNLSNREVAYQDQWGTWYSGTVEPYAVWTGSFNFTANAAQSFENAVLINDPEIAKAFYNEYAYLYGLSEQLDWETEWVAPEYRIGT